jgi:hypothetical protein
LFTETVPSGIGIRCDRAEIVAERLHGFQGWTDFAKILSFAGILHRRSMPAARKILREARANMGLVFMNPPNATLLQLR